MSDPRAVWSDERLAAAFAERGNTTPAAPKDLADQVIERVSGSRSNERRWSWLAAVATIALALGLGGYAIVGRVDHRPSPGHVDGSGGPQGSGGPNDPVLNALGEPVTVSAALTILDSEHGEREIVVTGFLSPKPAVPCPSEAVPGNPTYLHCPQPMQWLMEQPEQVLAVRPNAFASEPTGPAFHASFALVEAPVVPMPSEGAVTPVPVVLIGHFHDRRAALCEAPSRDSCGRTFIVDRVVSVNGAQRIPMTQRLTDGVATDLEEDVDSLVRAVAPHAIIESRQLVRMDQVLGIEPILEQDSVIGAWGNPADRMWLVTAVDLRDGVAIARTFAVIDGTNWFAEVKANGATMLERRATGGPSAFPPVVPSADPTAFDSAPTAVLGIKVRDIATVMRDRRADFGDLGRDEFAIRAWYVSPNPAASCEPALPELHRLDPPCDAARHWLVDRPEQLGTEVGQLRTFPEHYPPVLNPLLPIDVPFDVPATWTSNVATPKPVVVLGHFADHRVNTFAGNLYFVIDAVGWTPDRPPGSLDTLTRLSTNATEDPAAVLARIDALAGTNEVATWATVVDAADFAALDPEAAEKMPEFTSGPPVWVVRRLIENEMDGRQRLAVESAFTADSGQRTWITPSPDSEPDLATTLDLHDLDPRTRIVRVVDYDQLVRSVRPARTGESFAWRPTWPDRAGSLEVARGRTDREIAIRWNSGSCDPEWRVLINRPADGSGVYIQPQTYGDYCPEEKQRRIIVIEFDQPITLDQITSSDPNSSGG